MSVPDVLGLPAGEAQARCREAGFAVVFRRTGPPAAVLWPGDSKAQVVRVALSQPDEIELTLADPSPASPTPTIPGHIAIICDGNGRWAAARGLPRQEGHRAGTANVRRVVEWCSELGVRYLTFYAFSTENWRRPKEEVDGLMQLIADGARTALNQMVRSGVRVRVLGRIEGLPAVVQETVKRVVAATDGAGSMTVNLLLNYGGRADIVDACRSLAADVGAGRLSASQITEELLASRLATAGMPEPDLVIRTAGDLRLSNFLIWQTAYSELHFTPVPWPAFGRGDLMAAINEFSRRSRRYGGLGVEGP